MVPVAPFPSSSDANFLRRFSTGFRGTELGSGSLPFVSSFLFCGWQVGVLPCRTDLTLPLTFRPTVTGAVEMEHGGVGSGLGMPVAVICTPDMRGSATGAAGGSNSAMLGCTSGTTWRD